VIVTYKLSYAVKAHRRKTEQSLVGVDTLSMTIVSITTLSITMKKCNNQLNISLRILLRVTTKPSVQNVVYAATPSIKKLRNALL
jgi:hypothetical protein